MSLAALRLVVIVCVVSLMLILAAIWFGSQKPNEEIAYVFQPSKQSSDIYLMDVRSFVRIKLTHADDADNTSLVWSPDGSRLAYFQTLHGANSSKTSICVYDITTRCYLSGADTGAGLVWSPNGKSVAYRGVFDTFNTLDTDSGAIKTSDLGDRPTFWSWSPDGSQFLVAICDLNSGELGMNCQINLGKTDMSEIRFAYQREEYLSMPIWSPNGKQLVFSNSDEPDDAEIYVFDLASGIRHWVADVGFDPTWSPDGTQIAYTGADKSGRRHLYFINLRGGLPYVRADLGNWLDLQYRWSPDGSHILFMGDQSPGSYQMAVLDISTNSIADIPVVADQNIQFSWRP